jgi:hypothetical protein
MDKSSGNPETIKNKLLELKNKEEDFIASGKNMLSEQDMYMFDLYCTAILNRSLNLVRGFISLMKEGNFIAAAPLIRIHLDTLLRLYAFSLMDQDIDLVTMEIVKGKSMRRFKSRSGSYLTDSYLVESISEIEQFTWVKSIYEKLNGFVHMSDMHILASSNINAQEGIIQVAIRRSDEFIPAQDKLASITFMIMVSEGIVNLVREWIERKATYKKE